MDFREITEFIKDFFGYIVFIGVLIILFAFIIAIQPVAGNSMYPTLKEGEMVVVSKLFYNMGKPQRNDVVNVTDKEGKSYVKRVVGLPGEKIEYMNNILYINDEPYEESYLSEEVITRNILFEDICPVEDCHNGVIPEGMYLLLGDNRRESVDSRSPEFGLRNEADIKGKIVLKIWPIKEVGGIN